MPDIRTNTDLLTLDTTSEIDTTVDDGIITREELEALQATIYTDFVTNGYIPADILMEVVKARLYIYDNQKRSEIPPTVLLEFITYAINTINKYKLSTATPVDILEAYTELSVYRCILGRVSKNVSLDKTPSTWDTLFEQHQKILWTALNKVVPTNVINNIIYTGTLNKDPTVVRKIPKKVVGVALGGNSITDFYGE